MIRTLGLTFVVCLVCAIAVSISTVILRPIQEEHQRQRRAEQLTQILTQQPTIRELIGDIETAELEVRAIELATGAIDPTIDPATFDPIRVAREPASSRAIPPAADLARIERQAKHATVTLVRREGSLRAMVFPIYGRGYASIIRGSIAIAADANTVLGLTISEHGETPGLGSEITDPEWLASWVGKKLRNQDGELRLHVTVDEAAPAAGEESFRIDGISGATMSSEGTGNMARFWLGEHGFGPFLHRVQTGELR